MDREVITKSKVAVEKERNNGEGISRRSFIKGVGGVAAAATVLGLSGSKLKALAQPLPSFVTLPKEKLLEAYRRMQRIRKGEIKVREIVVSQGGVKRGPVPPGGDPGKIRGFIHSSEGEEAACVGVAMAMKKGDSLNSTHRSHGHPLAMGVALKPWMAELFGKVTGTNMGHGGSYHIADVKLGMLGSIGIVGAGVPYAVGAAKAAKLQGTDQVAVSTCGDGAMNSSGFNSSLNLAAIWNLPVVFVINNNQYEISVKAEWEQSLLRAGKDLSVRAAGYAIPGITVDGNDLEVVYKAAKYCIDRARQGKGPSLLECVTFRHRSHAMTTYDHEVLRWPYNDPDELKYWLRRDPIKRFEKTMLQGGLLTEAELASVQKQVDAEIEEAVEFAEKSPWPDPEEAFKYFREVFRA